MAKARVRSFLLGVQDQVIERVTLPLLSIGFAMSALFLAWLSAVLGASSGQVLGRLGVKDFAKILEVVILVVASYPLLRLGGAAAGTGILSNASLTHPEIYVPLVMILFGWHLCRTAGKHFAMLGSIAQSIQAQTHEEQEESLGSIVTTFGMVERRETASWFFGRRTMAYTLATVIFAAMALDQSAAMEPALIFWRWGVAGGTAALIFFGLAQQGLVHVYQRQTEWEAGAYEIAPGLVDNWVRGTLALVGLAVGVALVIPFRFKLLDFQSTMVWGTRWFEWFISRGVYLINSGLGGTAIAPPGPSAAPHVTGGSPVASDFTSFIYGFLTVLAMILIPLVGIWFWRRAYLLLELAIDVKEIIAMMLKWLAELFRRMPEVSPAALRRLRKERKERGSRRPKEHATVPPSYIRKLFVQLVREARRHGFHLRADHTPLEFATEVKAELGDVDEEIELLAQRYIEARYGERPVERTHVIESAWQKIYNRMKGFTRRSRTGGEAHHGG